MLHPVIESLFLLKVARGYVTESILDSEIEDKQELVNYIQNEASDYEVMHLVTLGEMPEEKFDPVAEAAVWDIFKEAVIFNAESLREDILEEDIMTMIYEMGPVSELGYSSAQPILEFAKASGTLDRDFLTALTEEEASPLPKVSNWEKFKTGATDAKTRAKVKAKKVFDATTDHVGKHGKKYSAAAGAAGVAALFGLYKLVKKWKAKRDAAKTPEAKKAAEAQIAKANAKIKKAKKA